MSDPSRAVIYVRISRDREDETSTTTQERICRDYAEQRGWTVAAVEIDRGRSAFKHDSRRAGLDRAMRYLRDGAADVLMVWKLDRFVRSISHFGKLWPQLRSAGASFVSVTDQFDTTTAMGRAMLQIAVVFAELESGIKSERISVWHDERKRVGNPPTGVRPFGYQRDGRTMTVDPIEGPIVRELAAKLLGGASLTGLAKELDARAVPTLRGGPSWRPITVRGILTSPTTAGFRRDGEVLLPGTWEPLLDRDTWDRVCAVILDPARRTSPGTDRRWLLSGRTLTCGRCADLYRARSSSGWRDHPRYVCRSCHRSVPVAALDEFVTSAVLDTIDPDTWRRIRAARRAPGVDQPAIERELAELADMYAAGGVTLGEWKVMRQGITDRIVATKTARVELPDVADLHDRWDELPVESKVLVLDYFIEAIVVGEAPHAGPKFNTDRIEIRWRDEGGPLA